MNGVLQLQGDESIAFSGVVFSLMQTDFRKPATSSSSSCRAAVRAGTTSMSFLLHQASDSAADLRSEVSRLPTRVAVRYFNRPRASMRSLHRAMATWT